MTTEFTITERGPLFSVGKKLDTVDCKKWPLAEDNEIKTI
jgi:hypothetical protein